MLWSCPVEWQDLFPSQNLNFNQFSLSGKRHGLPPEWTMRLFLPSKTMCHGVITAVDIDGFDMDPD